MAKAPLPGQVKTRLAQHLGSEPACRLYRAFIRDLHGRLCALGHVPTWAVSPPDARLDDLIPDARCVPQQGRDLGERMQYATALLFAEAAGPVLVLGADAPHVSADALGETEAALAADAEVVLGPAADGGYYLIGLRAPAPAVFTDVPWGGPDVFAITAERCRAAGLRMHVLAPSFDVDAWPDVVRLRRLVASGSIVLPHTAAVLATLPEDP